MYNEQQHYCVIKIKELAANLNRVPTVHEFKTLLPNVQLNVLFGTFDGLLKAAGLIKDLKPSKKNKQWYPQIDNPEQIKEIVHANSTPRIFKLNAKKIFCIGDAHFPWVNLDALMMCYQLIEREKPDVVIQMGDLKDQYSQSKFPRSLNVYTPQAEDEIAHEMAVDMWQKIRKLAPNAELFQLSGNHDSRALKRVIEKWPEGEHLVERIMKEKMTFDGVKTIHSQSEELYINDILFIHGHYSKLGQHRDYNRMNTVCGHSHRGGVDYKSFDGKIFWELNVGFIGDPYSKALTYRMQKSHSWTLGCGIIDSLGPRFVAF